MLCDESYKGSRGYALRPLGHHILLSLTLLPIMLVNTIGMLSVMIMFIVGDDLNSTARRLKSSFHDNIGQGRVL